MHSIKRAARRQAWYAQNGEDERTYNFFGRMSNPRRVRDEENRVYGGRVLAATVTENDLRTQREERRRIQWHSSEEAVGGEPKRAGSFSAAPSGRLPLKSASGRDHKTGWAPSRTESLHQRRSEDRDDDTETKPQPAIGAPTTSDPLRVDPFVKGVARRLSAGSMLRALVDSQGIVLWVLWAFVPTGFAVNYTGQNPIVVFVINFVAVVPSSSLLAFGVDQSMMYLGDKLSAILSMSFGNATQLISSVLLLQTRQIRILEASLLGSMLQNLLLMSGVAFFIGGCKYKEQKFDPRIAQTIAMLLLLAVLSLLIPTAARLLGHATNAGLLAISRGTAVLVMISYVMYLTFQLYTDRDMFRPTSEKAEERFRSIAPGEALKSLATMGATTGAASGGFVMQEKLVVEDEEDVAPSLTLLFALTTIVLSTVLLAFNTQFATDSVQGIMTQHNISESFMGIVILPLMSNDPNTVTTAWHDSMDMSMALALERCMQSALMVVPLIVLVAWGMGVDSMTMDFDNFSVAALFASIIIVTYVVQEGRSNWLTGALLIKVFAIIGLASYYTE